MLQVPEGYILIKIEEYENLLHTIQKLTARIEELESQLRKNSSNSHKPPSTEPFKKPIKNNRVKGMRKQGGQPGHEGKTLMLSENPDITINCKTEGFCECGQEINLLPIETIEKRQKIDIPEKLYEITEYQVEVRKCSCGKTHKAKCVQQNRLEYGNGVKTLATYMNVQQFIPFERMQEFFRDLIGINISDGVLDKSNREFYEKLEETEKQLKEAIIEEQVVHSDETSMRVNKKNSWVHNYSTQLMTLYFLVAKRGNEGMKEIGILELFKNVLVHDRWASYDMFKFISHALCNAHLLRDLKFVHEEKNKSWAKEMIDLLISGKDKKEKGLLTEQELENIEQNYQKIISEGILKEPPPIVSIKKRRGRVAKSKSLKLLEVFRDRKEDILRYLYEPIVPFDNNLAERDLRMIKLKQKISGCFRKEEKAKIFCRIRSYISSSRKQGYPVYHALKDALNGMPVNLIPIFSG
jgi:transposase